MVYLLEADISGQTLYKIGYTDNFDQRFKQHRVSNPDIVITAFKSEGTFKDEANIHRLCYKYRYSNEWFLGVPEVLDIFYSYRCDEHPTIDVPYPGPEHETLAKQKIVTIEKEVPVNNLDKVKELEYKLRIAELELENLRLKLQLSEK